MNYLFLSYEVARIHQRDIEKEALEWQLYKQAKLTRQELVEKSLTTVRNLIKSMAIRRKLLMNSTVEFLVLHFNS